VADYARATGITHDFDPQILGEGMARLGAQTRYEAVVEARRLGIVP
jgi:hypothetical protein